MSIQMKADQAYAYAELLEVLSLMEEEYTNRIPQKLMNIFETHKASEYSSHINPEVPLEEQEISDKTSDLLAMLMLNYWCDSEEQKQALKNTFEENERKYQEELKEKYNPNNIFNNQSTSEISEQTVDTSIINQEALPMDYATFPWYKKLVTKIRSFIYKLFKSEKNPT